MASTLKFTKKMSPILVLTNSYYMLLILYVLPMTFFIFD